MSAPLASVLASADARDREACWPWPGSLNPDGYGVHHFRQDGRSTTTSAHRAVYASLVGAIPDGHVLDHLCRNRACVNPAHLEPVSNRENILRGEGLAAGNAAKSTCPQGHPYDKQSRGRRYCSICKRQIKARRRAANR